MTAERVFLDTNLLIYALDGADRAKQARAREALQPSPTRAPVCSAQVLSEFASVALRKLGMSPVRVRDEMQRLERLSKLEVDPALVRAALDLCAERAISYWDAQIVAAAARLGCSEILTEDLNGGEVIAGVTVVNPFAGL